MYYAKHYGGLFYRKDELGREITCENGFLLVVDENGNGEPYFNLKTKEGRRNLNLWERLTKNK